MPVPKTIHEEIQDLLRGSESEVLRGLGILEDRLRKIPNDAHLHGLYGLALLRTGDLVGAAKALKFATLIDAVTWEWPANLGEAYLRASKQKEALQAFEDAYARGGRDERLLARLIEAYGVVGAPEVVPRVAVLVRELDPVARAENLYKLALGASLVADAQLLLRTFRRLCTEEGTDAPAGPWTETLMGLPAEEIRRHFDGEVLRRAGQEDTRLSEVLLLGKKLLASGKTATEVVSILTDYLDHGEDTPEDEAELLRLAAESRAEGGYTRYEPKGTLR